MISKKVTLKTPEKSRYGKLISYLVDAQGKNTRVGEVTISNCDSTELSWAVREIVATQQLNSRTNSDRTYHLLISMRAGENPDADTLKLIEERFCHELGYREHQRISVVHRDTDNVHIHVAINKIHPRKLTLHDPVRDYKTRSKLAAILEHELGLAHDRHERGERPRANDITARSGQQSFQAWLAERAQPLVDATSWAEFHSIASAYGVSLKLRANGFVFSHNHQQIHVKASSVHRQLSKQALEARMGTFIDADGIEIAEKERYEKSPAVLHNDTSPLWREYLAERELRLALRDGKLYLAKVDRARRIESVKAETSAQRALLKVTTKGVARQIAYLALNTDLKSRIREIHAQSRMQRQEIFGQTARFTWLDWLAQQAHNGREDAVRALRAANSRQSAGKTVSSSATNSPVMPALGPQVQVTKQGTVIERIGEFEIRDDGSALHISDEAGDDVILAMLKRCVERYGHNLATHGSEERLRHIARVAGIHQLPIVFVDAAIEQARLAARAAAPVPLSRAAEAYIAERNSKRGRMTDIQPHRLWQTSDAGEVEFAGLRAVENQNLLLTSNGSETLVLPISPQQRQTLALAKRGIPVMISTELLIQPHIQGLER
jgi:Relaxase/Mobilisation nuclease domain/Large polyvalent protein-associated domain 7